MSFTITRGANSVTLPRPTFGNLEGNERAQASAESVNKTFYVYDRAVTVKELRFTWENMDATDLAALGAFFNTHARGMKNTVDLSWQDWRPTQFGGSGGTITRTGYRFASPRIDSMEKRNALYRVTLVFRSN